MQTELGSSQVEVQQCALSREVGEELGDELARRKWRWKRRRRGGGRGGQLVEEEEEEEEEAAGMRSDITPLTWQVGKNSATRSKNILATPQKIEKYFPT